LSAIKDRGEYPVPRHAAYIWTAGDQIFVGFPPQAAEEFGHTVRLPADLAGMRALLETLKERERQPQSLIAQRAEPTQYQLDKIIDHMKHQKKVDREKRLAEADALLSELGL